MVRSHDAVQAEPLIQLRPQRLVLRGQRVLPVRPLQRQPQLRIHHRLGHIDGLALPDHGSLRPGLRSIDDDAKAVVARVLYEHRRYLLEDALRNFVLLPLRLFLGILADALECFLLLLDLLDQVGPRGLLVGALLCLLGQFLQGVHFIG